MKGSAGLVLVVQLARFVSCSVVGHDDHEPTKLFGRCTEERNTFDCLKRRALNILDSAVNDDSVYAVNDYVSIRRDPKYTAQDHARSFTNGTLDEQLEGKFSEYLSSRSIQLTVPGDIVQGRKKKDKFGGMLMMGGIAMAGMLAQLALGKIAFLAGTALLTAKIALVLSAIIGLKKLASGGGGGGNHEVIYATEHHGVSGSGGYGGSGSGGWQRSFRGLNLNGSSDTHPVYTGNDEAAQELAYGGQTPRS